VTTSAQAPLLVGSATRHGGALVLAGRMHVVALALGPAARAAECAVSG
jgi:hydrogenase maturation factor HypE